MGCLRNVRPHPAWLADALLHHRAHHAPVGGRRLALSSYGHHLARSIGSRSGNYLLPGKNRGASPRIAGLHCRHLLSCSRAILVQLMVGHFSPGANLLGRSIANGARCPRMLERGSAHSPTTTISRCEERCLTLPSSGPACGRPLKSNVRPRFNPRAESKSAVRCVTRAFVRAQVAAGVSRSARLSKVASQGRHGLSVLRRPAHGRTSPNTTEICSAFKLLSRSIEKQATSRRHRSSPESFVFLALSIHRFNSRGCRASGASGVGMLRHPPNTKQGCSSTSVA